MTGPVALVGILGDAPERTEVRSPGSAFGGISLHAELQRAGVTQAVLAGVATSIGVESSARVAHEHPSDY
ncbi:isochorismatase family protein [Actinomadura rudentiformis]|uniref:Isochorismatase family protein n=1 Tax=Actinomadura rudentiformis TaxID=359158 RepID=A0A6H9YRG1_9ACTN|nr:isochorismatase family protein [Actinomadura rudentiformis]KAB2343625.1 isochorismatase family protein [Actinomadura rudentiformis]